ncbi:MAG: hypothetical protein P4L51_20830 [Puia sp.]|nr:hypothetical protein [Puia sp.]
MGGSAYIYLNDPKDSSRIIHLLEGFKGVEEVISKSEAVRRFHLMPERIGDLMVLADSATVFGHLENGESEDLPATYRSHGSVYEAHMPLFVYNACKAPSLSYFMDNYKLASWLYSRLPKSKASSRIILAGHSQCVGNAGFLSKLVAVDRVLLFAGPQDYLAHFDHPAGWLSFKGKTPLSRYFSFLNLNDPFNVHNQLANDMKMMGMNKASTLHVWPRQAVEDHQHILVTDRSAVNGGDRIRRCSIRNMCGSGNIC